MDRIDTRLAPLVKGGKTAHFATAGGIGWLYINAAFRLDPSPIAQGDGIDLYHSLKNAERFCSAIFKVKFSFAFLIFYYTSSLRRDTV